MVQATATLQERISRLDRKLTARQTEELASLVGLLGFKLTPISAPKAKKPNKWEARFRARAYKGISYDQCKGVTNYFKGRLCPSNWPSDISEWYANPSARRDWYSRNWQMLAARWHYASQTFR